LIKTDKETSYYYPKTSYIIRKPVIWSGNQLYYQGTSYIITSTIVKSILMAETIGSLLLLFAIKLHSLYTALFPVLQYTFIVISWFHLISFRNQ